MRSCCLSMMSLVMHGGGRLAPAYAARADPRQAAGSKASPAIRACLSIGLAPVRQVLDIANHLEVPPFSFRRYE